MGLTVTFKGRLDDIEKLSGMNNLLIKECKNKNWKYDIYQEEEKRGVIVHLNHGESIDFTINSKGELSNDFTKIISLGPEEQVQEAQDILDLIHRIKTQYADNLVIIDETGYYKETYGKKIDYLKIIVYLVFELMLVAFFVYQLTKFIRK